MRCVSLLSALIVSQVAFQAMAADSVNLLDSLKPADAAKFPVRNARVYLSPETHALTLTFNYTAGEPEVRIPVHELGWPTDWAAYKAITFDFLATSLETVAIGFSDGQTTKMAMTEPLAGIRIRGVLPFWLFIQNKSMNPLLPLGYKVWPQRLFTFEKVAEIVFRMRYPNQTSQLTLYNLTLTPDVPEDGILDRKPLIDRYGQWIPENWPGKAHDDAELRALWDADTLPPAELSFLRAGRLAGETPPGHRLLSN